MIRSGIPGFRSGCPISLLDLYLIRELGRFFITSFILFTASGVAIGTTADLISKIREYQIPLTIALKIFGYKIPEYAAYCLPTALMFTGLVVYGRKQHNLELIALQSFGVSHIRLILPMLLLSLIITPVAFSLNELVIPAANYQANLLQQPFLTNLSSIPVYFAEYAPEKLQGKVIKNLYWAKAYQHPKLLGVTIIRFSQGKPVQLITAESAQWKQQHWQLTSGEKYQLTASSINLSTKEWHPQHLTLPSTLFEIAQLQSNQEEMSLAQAQKYLKLVEDYSSPRDRARLQVQIQQKYAFPYICVVFSLIGSALGVKHNQIHQGRSFAVCVFIVFGYYVLGFSSGSLGITGVISPVWAGWLPNLVGLICGSYLLLTAPK